MKRQLWSVTHIKHPQYPGFTVRVAEYHPGQTLHVFLWRNGKQISRSLKRRRIDLGPTTKAQEREARRLGAEFIEGLATAPSEPSRFTDWNEKTLVPATMTLAQLADKYEVDAFAGQTKGYKRDSLASIRKVAAFLDSDLAVRDLKPSHCAKYLADRAAAGHRVGGRGDLLAVSTACNWAVGEGLMDENPLASKRARDAMRIQHQPVRPFATKDRYEKLQAVAGQLPPMFGVLLAVAWHTGHRISAILELRWEHVSFDQTDDAPHGTITWYAGSVHNKKRHQHTLPMNQAASAALAAWRKECRAVGGWIFPALTKPTRRVIQVTTGAWLVKAERLAKVPHLPGGGWHMFRRGWATARKHMPLQDVAAGGGWTDTATVTKCYQHATSEETKAAATYVA